ncbi:MAG: photosensory histidine protein kinase LovK [Acetobacteraceae bacterium]
MPSEARFRQLMDATPVLIWCADADRRCIYFNKVWLDFTGRTMDQEFGCGWATGVHPDDDERRAALFANHFERRDKFRSEFRLRRRDGAWRWLLGTAVPRYDVNNAFVGFIGSCVDITELKDAEAQRQRDLDDKAALLQELHYRVKNNAQVFASLLTMQANRADNPAVQAALHTAASRASAMAIAQQQIYDEASMAAFDLGGFVRRLAWALGASVSRVTIEVQTPIPVLVSLPTAVPLALVVNELLTNAVRHGFPDERSGRIAVTMQRESEGRLCVSVQDNGVGLPPGVELEAQRSAGLTIVKSLARQLGAALWMETERGTRVCLVLPEERILPSTELRTRSIL